MALLQNLRVRAIAAAVLAMVASIGIWLWVTAGRESTDDAQIDAHVTQIAARVGGTVQAVYVDDNRRVDAGTTLVEIDPRDYQVAVEKARAALADAEAAAAAAQSGVPITTQSATSNLTSARGSVEQATATLDQAELNMQYATIKAPVAGIVSRKSVEVGQVVQAGQPLMAIIPLENVWVTANFKETQLQNMRPGQRATIKVDAYGGKSFAGKVDSIAAATGARFSMLPPENATGNYVKVVQRIPVKIVLDAGQDPDRQLRPGMSVEPTVYTK